MAARRASSRLAVDITTCSVCGCRLQERHIERRSGTDVCTFCGSPVPTSERPTSSGTEPQVGSSRTPLALVHPPVLPQPDRRGIRIALAALATIVLVLLAIRSFSGDIGQPSPPVGAAPPAPPAVAEPPGPASVRDEDRPYREPPARAVVVSASFARPCWVQVTVDGSTGPGRTYGADERQRWRASRRLTLVLGNAGGVVLEVNGRSIRTGPEGAVVRLELTLRHGRVVIERS
jgi:hypothetical protein